MTVTIHARQLEALLTWLVEGSGITQPRPDRRLNAIERQLMELSRQWRADAPIAPASELRMSGPTRDHLLDWVEYLERATGATRDRITIYASDAVLDPSVPNGWIRILLPTTTSEEDTP